MKNEGGRGEDNRAMCICVASNPMLFLGSFIIFFLLCFFSTVIFVINVLV